MRIRFVAAPHHRSVRWANRRKRHDQRQGRPVLNARTGILRGAGLAPRRSAADRRSVLMPPARLLFFRSHGFGTERTWPSLPARPSHLADSSAWSADGLGRAIRQGPPDSIMCWRAGPRTTAFFHRRWGSRRSGPFHRRPNCSICLSRLNILRGGGDFLFVDRAADVPPRCGGVDLACGTDHAALRL